MSLIPKNIERAIEEFSKLPGIGKKTAQRLTFYMFHKPDSELESFSNTFLNLKNGVNYCKNCQTISNNELCDICANPNRNKKIVCVIEETLDLIALEQANSYNGLYHVLHGVISPMNGVSPDELKIAELIDRIKNNEIDEIIFALNPSMEGEATASYILRSIPNNLNIKITRIARGIPVGGDLEYADSQTLKRSFEDRVNY